MKLNLGSGFRPIAGYDNIDNRPEVNPDQLFDICDGLPYADDSIEEVRAFDILEHIPQDKVIFVIEEIYRVLMPKGVLEIFTPSTDGRGAFQDPTHRSYWNMNTWLYFSDDRYRNLYGIKAKFGGTLEDRVTDAENKVIHTYGRLFAVK